MRTQFIACNSRLFSRGDDIRINDQRALVMNIKLGGIQVVMGWRYWLARVAKALQQSEPK